MSNDVYVLAHGKYKFGQNFPCDWVVVVVGKVCVCVCLPDRTVMHTESTIAPGTKKKKKKKANTGRRRRIEIYRQGKAVSE